MRKVSAGLAGVSASGGVAYWSPAMALSLAACVVWLATDDGAFGRCVKAFDERVPTLYRIWAMSGTYSQAEARHRC